MRRYALVIAAPRCNPIVAVEVLDKKRGRAQKRGPKCTAAIEVSDGFSAGVPSSWEVPAANCAVFGFGRALALARRSIRW